MIKSFIVFITNAVYETILIALCGPSDSYQHALFITEIPDWWNFYQEL
jgi:hypothetical protein